MPAGPVPGAAPAAAAAEPSAPVSDTSGSGGAPGEPAPVVEAAPVTEAPAAPPAEGTEAPSQVADIADAMSDEQLDAAIDAIEATGNPEASKLRRELANRRGNLRKYEEAFGEDADAYNRLFSEDAQAVTQMVTMMADGDYLGAVQWMLSGAQAIYGNMQTQNEALPGFGEAAQKMGVDLGSAAVAEPVAPAAAPVADAAATPDVDLYDPEQMASYVKEQIQSGIDEGLGKATEEFDAKQQSVARTAQIRQIHGQLDAALTDAGFATDRSAMTGGYSDERTTMLMSLVRQNPTGDPRQDVGRAATALAAHLGSVGEPAAGQESAPQAPLAGAAPPQVQHDTDPEAAMMARLDTLFPRSG